MNMICIDILDKNEELLRRILVEDIPTLKALIGNDIKTVTGNRVNIYYIDEKILPMTKTDYIYDIYSFAIDKELKMKIIYEIWATQTYLNTKIIEEIDKIKGSIYLYNGVEAILKEIQGQNKDYHGLEEALDAVKMVSKGIDFLSCFFQHYIFGINMERIKENSYIDEEEEEEEC